MLFLAAMFLASTCTCAVYGKRRPLQSAHVQVLAKNMAAKKNTLRFCSRSYVSACKYSVTQPRKSSSYTSFPKFLIVLTVFRMTNEFRLECRKSKSYVCRFDQRTYRQFARQANLCKEWDLRSTFLRNLFY